MRETLERSHAGEPVREAVRQSLDGRTVYIIEIETNNAPNPHIRIAEDGTLLRGAEVTTGLACDGAPVLDPYGTGAAPVFPKMQLADLPETVQQTARSQANGREIVD